jgi:hypothetical protein
MRRAIVLFLLSAAATAHADGHEMWIGESARALRTSSANALTDDGLFGGSAGYAYLIGRDIVPHLELWAHGAIGGGTATGEMFQTLDTEIHAFQMTVGGGVRYELHPRVAALARLDVGTLRAAVAIRDDAGHSACDHGWGAMTSAGVGLDLYAIRRPRFSLGLRFELSAVATSSIPLTATPDSADGDTLQLDMTAAPLGSLNLSGPSFAFSLVGQL